MTMEALDNVLRHCEVLEHEIDRLTEALEWYVKTFCEFGESVGACGKMGSHNCSGCLAYAAIHKKELA